MPLPRFSHTPDSQVDPFNAGDPVMPGEEPEWLDEEGFEGTFDDAFDEPSYAPHGDRDGVPHKTSDNYQAPTTRGHDYDAPTIDAPARTTVGQGAARWRQAAETLARRADSGKWGGSGCAIAIIAFFLFFGGLGDALVGCAGTFVERVGEGIGTVFDDGISLGDLQLSDDLTLERDWREHADELDLDAADAFERRMDVLLADPSADPATGFVASAVDGYVLTWVGYGTDALGIDAHAAAVWALSDLTYEIESVYAYDDGTATIYLDTEAPSLVALVDAADDDISAYLIANDLSIWDGSDPGELSDAQRAETSAIWAEALDRTEELNESFLSVELTRTDGVWAVDEASLEEMLRKSVGLY